MKINGVEGLRRRQKGCWFARNYNIFHQYSRDPSSQFFGRCCICAVRCWFYYWNTVTCKEGHNRGCVLWVSLLLQFVHLKKDQPYNCNVCNVDLGGGAPGPKKSLNWLLRSVRKIDPNLPSPPPSERIYIIRGEQMMGPDWSFWVGLNRPVVAWFGKKQPEC